MDQEKTRHYAMRFTFDWLPAVLKTGVVVCAVSLSSIVFAQVILRYIIKAPLLWVEEVAVFPAFWMYLLGAAYGAYTRTHIKVDLLDILMKNVRRRQLMRIITAAITVVISFMFVYWAYNTFVWDLSMNQRSYTLALPMVWARASMFFGGLFIAFYFVVELIDSIGQYRGRPPMFILKEEDQI
ncbi:MAG: TRAP transporter small permease [Dehalococcoidia bacterium]|jgi:TRAP-type C4-dicarboxylate transport system permease small subunit|nr:TRAP transporter small permease [Dehalococcoidia bacterium]